MTDEVDINEQAFNHAEMMGFSEQELYSLLNPSFNFDYDIVIAEIKTQIDELFPPYKKRL